jgi:DHA2 family multidrug resistance protein
MCAWTAALAGAGFAIRSLTYARPIVDLRAFASRNFTLGCWFSFVTGVGTFGLIYLTPLFLGHVRGFIAWQIGGAILWAGPFQLATVPIYSFLANRVDLRLLLIIGLVCFSISMWLFTPIMNQWGFKEMLLPFAFRGIAVPFAIASTVTLTLGNLPPDRLKSASSLFACDCAHAVMEARHEPTPRPSPMPKSSRSLSASRNETILCVRWSPL